MPKATDIRDCQRFASAITAVGGTVPNVLGHLLSSYELLSRPGRFQAPESSIIDHALGGSLTAEKLDKLLPAAATGARVNTYRGELARSAEHVLLGAFHRELENGAADEILDSLRPDFDRAAEAIGHARSLINPESTAEQVIESGQPELVTAWQQLDGHLGVINRIAAVASAFGPRLGLFPQVREGANLDGFRVNDNGIMCADGPSLELDSAMFQRPDSGHRSSPWFRLPLRLHSTESAQARYNRWAADQFDAQHAGPRGGWVDADGHVHEHPVLPNPFRQEKTNA